MSPHARVTETLIRFGRRRASTGTGTRHARRNVKHATADDFGRLLPRHLRAHRQKDTSPRFTQAITKDIVPRPSRDFLGEKGGGKKGGD